MNHTPESTGSIQFVMGDSTEVLRISKDGITVNPDVPVDEIAASVLELLEKNIRVLVQRAVEAEREACAQVCDGWLHADGDRCADAIRERGNS